MKEYEVNQISIWLAFFGAPSMGVVSRVQVPNCVKAEVTVSLVQGCPR